MLTGQPHPLLVLLHGFGADEKDLMTLRPYIDPAWAMVSIRAPFREGAGFRWYALESVHSWDADELNRSMEALKRWFGKLGTIFPHLSLSNTVVGGFSQGAVMALALGLFAPKPVAGGIMVFSGYLPILPDHTPSYQKIPVFWGHGENDLILPYNEAKIGYEQLIKEEVPVSFHSYKAGHEVVEEELSDAVSWLKQFRA